MVYFDFSGIFSKKVPKSTKKVPKVLKENLITKLKVISGTFWKICRIQIKIYPQTSIVPKYDAFYSNNEVRDQT